jgi:large subunit ribosomal protein L31
LPTVKADGVTYPMVDVDVSSGSHPFWTGRRRPVDTESRIQAFQRRFGSA